MYPTLTSIGSGSRWYSKKQTPQEVLDEITEMEEQLQEKKMKERTVGVQILIRGKPAVNSVSSNMNDQEDTHDVAEEEDDEVQDPMMEEGDDDASNNYNANSDLYNQYDPYDDDEAPPSPDYSQYDANYPTSPP